MLLPWYVNCLFATSNRALRASIGAHQLERGVLGTTANEAFVVHGSREDLLPGHHRQSPLPPSRRLRQRCQTRQHHDGTHAFLGRQVGYRGRAAEAHRGCGQGGHRQELPRHSGGQQQTGLIEGCL